MVIRARNSWKGWGRRLPEPTLPRRATRNEDCFHAQGRQQAPQSSFGGGASASLLRGVCRRRHYHLGRLRRSAARCSNARFCGGPTSALGESYLTGKEAENHLWDSGHALSLRIADANTVVLEIPMGAAPWRFPLGEFVAALRRVTLELLWMMYDDGLLATDAKTGLLTDRLFWPGSVLHQAAQLIVSGKLSRPH
jgi:hypothetical protein